MYRDYSFDLMDALSAPVMTFSQQWADSIPERVLKAIPMGRMVQLMKREEKASDPEIVAYLITRSFEAPMDHDWADIYTHICCKVCQDFWGEDSWEKVHAPRELSDWPQRLLNDLRIFIYEKRRKALKAKLKCDKQPNPKEDSWTGTRPMTLQTVMEMPESGSEPFMSE